MRPNNLCRSSVLSILVATASLAHPPAFLLTANVEAQSAGTVAARTSDAPQLPGSPQLMTVRGLRYPTNAEARLLAGPPSAAFPYECSVDFDDSVTLSGVPNLAADTVAYAPWWFQNCGGNLANHAVVRPVEYSHYHLGFEDDTIVCLDLATATYGRYLPDMTCSSAGIDYLGEPRYVAPHWGDGHIHLYVVNQDVNPNDPYSDSTYDKKPFDLKRLRVRAGSPPVRVCYKKVQEIEGPWIAAPDVPLHESTPGVWLCWAELGPALWDLSAWAKNVREVKVAASDGDSIFSIDDLLVGVQ
jgi:hypothetical protein